MVRYKKVSTAFDQLNEQFKAITKTNLRSIPDIVLYNNYTVEAVHTIYCQRLSSLNTCEHVFDTNPDAPSNNQLTGSKTCILVDAMKSLWQLYVFYCVYEEYHMRPYKELYYKFGLITDIIGDNSTSGRSPKP